MVSLGKNGMDIKLQNEIELACKRQGLPIYGVLIFHICKGFDDYIKFLTCMCNREDCNGYYDYVVFPENVGDADGNVQSLDKHQVCFGFHEDTDIVDCMEVYRYLEVSTNIYLKRHPEHTQDVLEVLEKLRQKYLS
jgi:hypothetical protein